MFPRVSIPLLGLVLAMLYAKAEPSLPRGFQMAPNTASPGGHYAFSAPLDEMALTGDLSAIHNSLIDLQKGKPIAAVLGLPGCIRAYKGGILNPWWAKDESAVAWSCINRSCQGSLVVIKIKAGKVEWQVNVLKASQEEIASRFKDYYLSHLKKPWPEGGLGTCDTEVNTIPDFFSGQTVEPLTLPLKFHVRATPPPAVFDTDAALDGTVQPDGTIRFAAFRVSNG